LRCPTHTVHIHLNSGNFLLLQRQLDTTLLPPFPTLRSSDLRLCRSPARCAPSSSGRGAQRDTAVRRGRGRRRAWSTPVDVLVLRSEEHTSELQSRRAVVCRLLLEQKKVLTHIITASRGDFGR